MKQILAVVALALMFSSQVSATKGLIDTNVLASPTGEELGEVPSPKIDNESSVIDLNLTDRTNQAMTLQSLNATQEIFDTSDPYVNTLRTNYQDNKTIKVRVREFMGTLIILPEGDQIKLYKLGDTDNFTFEPSISSHDTELPSSGTASVILPGADTSLHILGTSGNHYSFYLRGDTWESKHHPTMKVIITDDKLLARLEAQKRRQEQAEKKKEEAQKKEIENPDYLESVEFNPANLNFGYRIKGGIESIRPFMVYSDGHFTYFRFDEAQSVAGVKSFPAVYRVADQSDVPVNTTAQGSTLRAEGIANNWTLRLGNDWLCIEKIQKTPGPVSSMNSFVKSSEKPSHNNRQSYVSERGRK